MGAEWVPKTWKIFNLATTNAILIKFTTILNLQGETLKLSRSHVARPMTFMTYIPPVLSYYLCCLPSLLPRIQSDKTRYSKLNQILP